jgi:dTDP-4-dehydrorhamnose 3,5-epimerase
MMAMQFSTTDIPEILIISPQVYLDHRGDFRETYRKADFWKAGIEFDFIQDNHASSKKGVLRGLHYQIQQPQGKLIQVVVGEIFDVAVDLRKSSPTFGGSVGIELSQQNNRMLWIPPGFAHGYYVLSDTAEVCYKVTEYFAPNWERTLLWNDPDLNIEWPLLSPGDPIISEKDSQGIPLKDAEVYE